ncbi:MAG: ABC transporter ATP-binding protein [Hyphomicrobiales bacterium]|nr:ABC transporter ATP-binding protein [Hyphomicrobiales bacterium]
MQAEMPMILINDLHLTLGTGASRVHVLKGLDIQIDEGKSTGIVGPSGSGKSTLLMVIGGLERSDSGSVIINNHDLDTMNEDQLAAFRGRNIGIVFQSFHLIPNMTALENVAVPLELSGQTNAMRLAEDELAAVGLGERLNHYPTQLSGGEQQRVAIARALAPRPKILIADEPTGNLDDDTGDQIINLLFEKQREHSMTLALVTHNSILADQCDQIVHVRSGIIESDLTLPKEIQSLAHQT